LTRCMRPVAAVVKKASCRAGGRRPAPPLSEQLKANQDPERRPEDPAVEIVRKALSRAGPPGSRSTPVNGDGSVIVGKIPREGASTIYGFELADRSKYGNLVSKGIIDPTKVVRGGDPENAASGRGSPDHHRSHDRRNCRRRPGAGAGGHRLRGGGHGRHGFLIQPLRRISKGMQKPRQRLPGVFVWGGRWRNGPLLAQVNADARLQRHAEKIRKRPAGRQRRPARWDIPCLCTPLGKIYDGVLLTIPKNIFFARVGKTETDSPGFSVVQSNLGGWIKGSPKNPIEHGSAEFPWRWASRRGGKCSSG